METESKTVLLAALTLITYGLVSFLGGGPFAFFPINEVVFAGIVLYFSFSHFKSAPAGYVLLASFGLLGLLNNQLFLSFFMDYEDTQLFHENALVKILKPGIYLLLLVEITRFYYLSTWRTAVYTYPVVLAGIIAGVWYNTHLFLVFGLLVFAVTLQYVYRKRPELAIRYPKSLFYLWLLLAFLKLSTLLTIYLYDLDIDI